MIDIYTFMEKHSDKNFTIDGYAVHVSRGDYRVSYDSLSYDGPELDKQTLDELRRLGKNAEEFNYIEKDHIYLWWD